MDLGYLVLESSLHPSHTAKHDLSGDLTSSCSVPGARYAELHSNTSTVVHLEPDVMNNIETDMEPYDSRARYARRAEDAESLTEGSCERAVSGEDWKS